MNKVTIASFYCEIHIYASYWAGLFFLCFVWHDDDDDGCCWLLIAASLPLSRSRSASFTQFLLSSFPIISLLALLYQLKTIRFARRRCLIIYTVYNMFLLGRARDDVFSVYFGFTYIHTQLRSHFTSVHSVLSIHCEQFGSVAHSDFYFSSLSFFEIFTCFRTNSFFKKLLDIGPSLSRQVDTEFIQTTLRLTR